MRPSGRNTPFAGRVWANSHPDLGLEKTRTRQPRPLPPPDLGPPRFPVFTFGQAPQKELCVLGTDWAFLHGNRALTLLVLRTSVTCCGNAGERAFPQHRVRARRPYHAARLQTQSHLAALQVLLVPRSEKRPNRPRPVGRPSNAPGVAAVRADLHERRLELFRGRSFEKRPRYGREVAQIGTRA